MKPDFQGVRTHSNQGFLTFRKARRPRIVMLMIPVRLESGSADDVAPVLDHERHVRCSTP